MVLGGAKGVKKFKHGYVAYQVDGSIEQHRMHQVSNWWPSGEVKTSNIIKFRLPCQFQRINWMRSHR